MKVFVYMTAGHIFVSLAWQYMLSAHMAITPAAAYVRLVHLIHYPLAISRLCYQRRPSASITVDDDSVTSKYYAERIILSPDAHHHHSDIIKNNNNYTADVRHLRDGFSRKCTLSELLWHSRLSVSEHCTCRRAYTCRRADTS